MADQTGQTDADRVVRALLVLFFVSGATALAYQVLWLRELQLVFGTSTFAISTLLASFMAGLGAGGFVIARYADRIRHPLAVYGLLELGIGLYALIFPFLLDAIAPLYLETWRAMEPGPVTFGLVQFALVGGLLLPPTAAMGATLPLLARFAARRFGTAGERIGTLYAVNTFGAVAGIWLCGFLLLPDAGIRRTTLMAAAANLLLGLAALGLHRLTRRSGPVARDAWRDAGTATPVMVAVCMAIGLAGFSALVYEVGWTRLLTLMLGGSAYTFAVMLMAFLTGIAVGGRLGGSWADRLLAAGGPRRVLVTFAALEMAIAFLATATMYLYPDLPVWYVGLFDRLGAAENTAGTWWVSLLLAGLVMTPPAALMGMHFPLAARAVAGYRQRLARPVGILYGINSLGAAIGAFLAGFVLLPALGMQGTIMAAAGAGLAAAVVLLVTAGVAGRLRALLAPLAAGALLIALVAARPPWNPLLMTAGMYHYVSRFDDHSRAGVMRFSVGLYDLVYYEEGLSSVVTVGQTRGTPQRWLAINGKVDASTAEDMPTQVLLSLLPLQFVEQPDDVLVIGLASGVTAGAASLVPQVSNLQIVELEPAVGRAARYFDPWNHAVLSDPRVDLVYNDGRNQLLLAEPQSYDVIVSEPSNPWISGVANLFTREFLEIGKSRLKEGGVWSQWVPIYGLDGDDLRSILATFAEVFPQVAVFSTIDYNDLVLVGSDFPLAADRAAADRLFRIPAVAGELRRVGIDSAADMAALRLMDRAGVEAMSSGARLNTDDNMLIEYSAAKLLHVETRSENFSLLQKYSLRSRRR